MSAATAGSDSTSQAPRPVTEVRLAPIPSASGVAIEGQRRMRTRGRSAMSSGRMSETRASWRARLAAADSGRIRENRPIAPTRLLNAERRRVRIRDGPASARTGVATPSLVA